MTAIISMVLQRKQLIWLLALCILSLGASPGLARTDNIPGSEGILLLLREGQTRPTSRQSTLWHRRPARGKGPVESLAIDPRNQERVLLCQYGVVWISLDEGQSYSPIFKSDSEQGVTAAFHPTVATTFYLATNRVLLISYNAGKDWMRLQPGLEFKWRPRAILFSNEQSGRMYITTQGSGVYRSDDDGHIWKAINSGLPEAIGAGPVAPLESAVLDPTDPDVVYLVAEANGIYKTTSGGETWTRASRGLPGKITRRTLPWVLAINPANPQRLLVWAHWPVHSEGVASAFFLSEDGAENWRKIAAGSDLGRVLAIQFVDAEDVLADIITEDGVKRLSN